MNEEIDIENIANLARIDITEEAADDLEESMQDILSYVASVEEVAENADTDTAVGPVHNVLRDDADPHEPGVYREEILAEAPKTERGYVVVPPIL